MAKKTIIVSDLTGKEIETLAVVKITVNGTTLKAELDEAELPKGLVEAAIPTRKYSKSK